MLLLSNVLCLHIPFLFAFWLLILSTCTAFSSLIRNKEGAKLKQHLFLTAHWGRLIPLTYLETTWEKMFVNSNSEFCQWFDKCHSPYTLTFQAAVTKLFFWGQQNNILDLMTACHWLYKWCAHFSWISFNSSGCLCWKLCIAFCTCLKQINHRIF